MDDLKKQLYKKDERMFELVKQYKDEKFVLEKENIELGSQVKVLEIKVEELAFQLNSMR